MQTSPKYIFKNFQDAKKIYIVPIYSHLLPLPALHNHRPTFCLYRLYGKLSMNDLWLYIMFLVTLKVWILLFSQGFKIKFLMFYICLLRVWNIWVLSKIKLKLFDSKLLLFSFAFYPSPFKTQQIRTGDWLANDYYSHIN